VIPFGRLNSGDVSPRACSYPKFNPSDASSAPTVLTDRLARTAYYCRFSSRLSNGAQEICRERGRLARKWARSAKRDWKSRGWETTRLAARLRAGPPRSRQIS